MEEYDQSSDILVRKTEETRIAVAWIHTICDTLGLLEGFREYVRWIRFFKSDRL